MAPRSLCGFNLWNLPVQESRHVHSCLNLLSAVVGYTAAIYAEKGGEGFRFALCSPSQLLIMLWQLLLT
eukprot:9496131-Pyramimonas_sp.AAC.2